LSLSALVTDLVLMLVVAGVTSVVFKKLRQPLVLGYIVAGFLIGPSFTAIPTVIDMDGIHIWAEVGIVCIMFAHGLEFSFHKLAHAGNSAIVTSLTKVAGISVLGFFAGRALGWSLADSLVLGGVLTISAATIIVKAFEELNLRGRGFTRVVAGTLVMVELGGVFLMVTMSTYVQNQSGGELAVTIAQLLLYLALWLILGIFVIPSVLKRAKNLMNDETLLIVALGVCFGMALLFANIGLSAALGAFIAGSILAGTIFAEKIEHLHNPVKNLFGAIFFISVGMLVEPAAIVNYAWPIILLALVTIVGNLLFSPLGVLLSGQKLHTAIFSGVSMTQIGEFSFVIIAFGLNLGLISEFLYPVVISVSVITTFTTPYFVRNAETIYTAVKKILPAKLLGRIDGDLPAEGSVKEKDTYWKWFARRYIVDTLVKGIIAFGILQLGIYFIGPLVERFIPSTGGRLLTTGIVFLCMAPFLATLLYQRGKDVSISRKANRIPQLVVMTVRIALTVFILLITAVRFLSITWGWIVIPAVLLVLLISRSDWIVGRYLNVETLFLSNFHEKRLLDQTGPDIIYDPGHGWISEQLWIEEYIVGQDCKDVGTVLRDLKWRRDYHVNIIKIISSQKHFNIPDAAYRLQTGDIIFLLGAKDKTDMFEAAATRDRTWPQKHKGAVKLRDFIVSEENEHGENRLFCYSILVEKGERFEGRNVKSSKIGVDFNCNIIGIQRDNYHIIYPDSKFVLQNGDQIWVLGGYKMVGQLIVENLIQTEEQELADALDGRR
jgi:CPA2 family monovalent cation:H+ antiporter-2